MDNQDEGVQKDVPVENDESRANSEEPTVQEADQPTETKDQPGDQSPEPEQSENDENIKNQPEGRKETRQTRRIANLVEKLKATGNQSTTDSRPLDEIFGTPNQNLLASDEEGNLDPVEFQRRYEQQRINDREIIKRELQAEAQYKETINTHLSDVEKTLELMKDDDVLDDIVAEQYHNVNYRIDPYTGQEVFEPKVLMSDLFRKQQQLLERKIALAQADVTGRLATQSDGAIPPGGVLKQGERDYSNVSDEDKWNNPRSIASDIEKKYGYKD